MDTKKIVLLLMVVGAGICTAATPVPLKLKLRMERDSALAVVGDVGRRDTTWYERERRSIRTITVDSVDLYGSVGSLALSFGKTGRLLDYSWVSLPGGDDSPDVGARVRDSIAAHFRRDPVPTGSGVYAWEGPVTRHTLVTDRALMMYVAMRED